MPTRSVIQEVRNGKWFKLSYDDLRGRYPGSKKKIVDSVVKFARKNLVMKGEVFPVGEGNPIGIWKITAKGADMAQIRSAFWKPRYSTHDALVIEEEK